MKKAIYCRVIASIDLCGFEAFLMIDGESYDEVVRDKISMMYIFHD